MNVATHSIKPGLSELPSADPASFGVYVHFPWCLKKCPYCDFLSVASKRADLPHSAYADAVLAELERRAPALQGRPLASVFFGGGTPSLWDPRELGRVLRAIRQAFGNARAADIEVTVECNPTSFDRDRGRALFAEGVNRVSIGVQSLDAERLTFLGRLHDVDGGLRALEDALASGVPRVSADLIFGVPGQSVDDAVSEAKRVIGIGPTHVSLYALTVEPGTEFGALAKKGKLPLANDDVVVETLLALGDGLCALGFDHYEISNYARSGHYAAHNLGYWRGRDYVGLGCGAWGTVSAGNERVRYRNVASPERYLAGDTTESHREIIDAETSLRERLMLGLRLRGGVDVDAEARALGVRAWPSERERARDRWLAAGKLVEDGGRIWIPEAEWPLADGIIASLL